MFICYFVSDIHLGSMQDHRAQFFLNWLKAFKDKSQITHLFLMGDIFDLWIAEHQYFIEKYQLIIKEIKRLKSLGVEIHFFEGNHDLYLTKFWQNQLGVVVHKQASLFEIEGKTFALEHGDQMDPEDRGYIFLRWFLRTPFMKFVAPRLPSRWIVKIGEEASQKSRKYTSTVKSVSNEAAIKKFETHVQNRFNKEPFDYLVAGHMHINHQVNSKNFRAWNLGSWFDKGTILKISNNGVEEEIYQPTSN